MLINTSLRKQTGIALRTICLSTLLWISQYAQTQVTIKVLEKHGHEDREAIFFPLIDHEKKVVADKINLDLQKELLSNESIIKDSTAFSNALFQQTDSSFQAGYTYISYDLDLNTPSVFSLRFAMESMGAYPEGYSKYYNFHLASGERITVNEVLNSEGKKFVLQLLKTERTKIIAEEIAAIKNELTTEDLKYVKEVFKKCNTSPDFQNFHLREYGIMFYKEFCFPHVARAYESNLDIFIPYSRLSKYLTPFGKKIVSEIE